ncbi:MAG TPA: GNAT family N-acetyltransferase [Ktedonobacteraceae bacterium]
MAFTPRILLRLHIEAVWGVQLPPITHNTVELLGSGPQPSWRLYLAKLAGEQIAIWRPDVAAFEQEALLMQAREALALPPASQLAPRFSREVALHQVASPTISLATAQDLARLLTPDDRALVETFTPGYSEYFFHPDCRPLVGVVVGDHLLSLAHSSRWTPQACELGIDTLLEARRKGYALAATLLWTTQVSQENLIPFYSADAANAASLGLASAAGYRAFAQGVTIEAEQLNP